MQDNDMKQRTLRTFGLPPADVDFLVMLQKFIEREAERPLRVVRDWLTIRIDGVDQCVIDSETWCRLEFEGGTSKVEIVGRDAEGEVVIATYLPTYDGPKTETWKVSLPWGDEVRCAFEYDDEECVRVEAKRIVRPKSGEVHAQLTRAPQQGFFAFDRAYLERLGNGDPATEDHFFRYFERFLNVKLRARAVPSYLVEDLRQETLVRVIGAVRKEGRMDHMERFGAFVNSICNNVLLEHYRSLRKNQQVNATYQEIPDKVLDLEGMMVSNQVSERVHKILSALPARDRDLLLAVLLEEKDKDAVCREMGVDRHYLRVLMHRAKDKFKSLVKDQQIDATHQEIPDKALGPKGMMSNQFPERARKILSALPARDRDLLRAVLLEGKDKDAVCREMGVDRDYLRVLLHRAKDKFKDQWADLAPVWDNLLNED